MPYAIRLPDGTLVENIPDDLDPVDAKAQIAAKFKLSEPVSKNTSGFSDVATAAKQGLVGTAKSLTDVFGAENEYSQKLGGVQQRLEQEYTPARALERQKREQLQEEAAKSGDLINEITTYLGGVTEAPVQALASGLASIVPYVGTGIIGGVFKLGAPTVAALNSVLGASQGAGSIKGSVYSSVKKELEKRGMDPKEAEDRAIKAQEYLGENWKNIIAGAGIGAVAGRKGVEELLVPGALSRQQANIIPRVATTVLKEAPIEGLQGGQQQFAENVALQQEGFDVPTFQGVAGSAARDAAVGAITAAPLGAIARPPKVDLEATYTNVIDELRNTLGTSETLEPQEVLKQIQKISQLQDPNQIQALYETALNNGDFNTVPMPDNSIRIQIPEAGIQQKAQEAIEDSTPEAFTPELRQSVELFKQPIIKQMQKFGLSNVGLKIFDTIENGRADGYYANKVIALAMDSPSPLGTLRHETVHALKELGGFKPNEWNVLSKKAEKEWTDQFIKNVKIGDGTLYDQYQAQYQKDNNDSLDGFDDYIKEEAIAEAFKHFDVNGAPPGLVGNLYYRLKQFFETLRNGFTGAGFDTTDKIFTRVEQGKAAPTIEDVAEQPNKYAIKPDLTTKEGVIEDGIRRYSEALEKHLGNYYETIGEQDSRRINALYKIQDNIEKRLEAVGVQTKGPSGKPYDSEMQEIFSNISGQARSRFKERVEAKESKQPTKYAFKQTPAPEDVPQDIWDLYSKYDRITKMANEKIPSEPNAKGVYPRPQDLKKEETLSFRRLNKAIGDYFGAEWDGNPSGPIYDMYVRLNEEMGNRDLAQEESTLVQPDIKYAIRAPLDNAFQMAKQKDYKTNRALKVDLQKNTIKKIRQAKINLNNFDEKTIKYLSSLGVQDALHALKTNQNAIGWYDVTVAKALNIISLLHPEIKTNPDDKLAFTWALAVTSNGIKVDKNFELAETAYDYYKKNGRMPTNIQAGQATKAINDGLETFNEMVKKYGVDNTRKFMATEFTPKEIEQLTGIKINGELVSTNILGASVLGPKIGNGFYSNLNGIFDKLTMDRWLMRTWGRWTGTLIERNNEQIEKTRNSVAGLLNDLVEDEETLNNFQTVLKRTITKDDLETQETRDAISNAIAASTVKPQNRAIYNQTELGEKLRTSSNNLAKYLDGQKEAPKNGTERNQIRAVFNEMLTDLRKRGYNKLTMSDLQALLWYPERRLYDTAKESSIGESYEDSEAPDYANAASKLVKENGIPESDINKAIKETEDSYADRTRDIQPTEVAKPVETSPQAPARGFTEEERADFAEQYAPPKKVKQKFSLRAPNTPEFKRWFGNSKVVDENGNPLVVYHGTDISDFSIFNPASWFSEYPKEASAYTLADKLKIREKSLKKYTISDDTSMDGETVPYAGILSDHENPEIGKYYGTDNGVYKYLGKNRWEGLSKIDVNYDAVTPDFQKIKLKKVNSSEAVKEINDYNNQFAGKTEGEGGRVYPVYLSIKNPLYLHALEANKFSERLGKDKSAIEKQIKIWKSQGYDGIITESDEATLNFEVREELGGIPKQYVPFDSSQIKSATGNKGTFDATNPDIRYAIRAPQTPAFKRWFGSSKIVNEDGTPKVMYHGTARDISEFRPKQANAIFLTDNPKFAETFSDLSSNYMVNEVEKNLPKDKKEKLYSQAKQIAKKEDTSFIDEYNNLIKNNLPSAQNVMPVFVKAETPFDYENPEHLKKILQTESGQDLYGEELPFIKQGAWDLIEKPHVQRAIKEAGFDSFYVREGGNKNLAVYNSNQIKSATGNIGTFDIGTPDIRYSLNKLTTLQTNKNAGQKIGEAYDIAKSNFGNSDYWIAKRNGWIDPSSGLAKSLQKLPVFNLDGELRADMLVRAKSQALNLIKNGLLSGIPVLNADGTIGIERSENNFARSMYLADQLDKNATVKASGLSGRGYVAEVARILRGADILKEDARLNAEGVRQLAEAKIATKEAKDLFKQGKMKEARKKQKEAKKLREEGTANAKSNRELQVTPAHIKWAEQQLAKVPEMNEILGIWKTVNNGLVDLWESVGLLSESKADEYRGKENYIPLFKSQEDLGDAEFFAFPGGGLKSTKGFKRLKGSTAIRNIWENLDKHYAVMLSHAYENQTRRVAVSQLKSLQLAESTNANDPESNLWYKEDGKKVGARVENLNDLAAFQMMTYELGPIMQFFAGSTQLLRAGALINPMYWIKQLIRDPIHANLVAGSGMITPLHSMRGFVEVLMKNSRESKILTDRGVLGSVDSTTTINQFLEQFGKEKASPSILSKALSKVMSVHEASDAATRVEIYKKAEAKALKEGKTAEQAMSYAVHMARESINFSVHGNSPTLNALRHSIPFFSAAINSLDTVYRAATGFGLNAKEKKEAQLMFFNRAVMMTILSTMYAMLYQDDEEYKKLPDYVKDNNWLIPNPMSEKPPFIKVPTPFEIGFFFKTIPEGLVRYFSDTSTGKEVLASYKAGLIHNLPANGLPIPQAIKPVLENIVNYSFFTGRGIEGMSDQGRPVAERGQRASEFAKTLSSYGLDRIGQSPAKIDNLIQGYFAELGTFSAGLASSLLFMAEGKEPPAKNIENMPFMKAFLTDRNVVKAISDFYELDHNAKEVATQFNDLKQSGMTGDIQRLIDDPEKKAQLMASPVFRKVSTQMATIRKAIEYYKDNQDSGSPEFRRDKINELTEILGRVAESGYKIAEATGVSR